MTKLMKLPDNYNYIGVFLTFRCNLTCRYCLNWQGDLTPRHELRVDEWLKILAPVPTRMDLPITLQGGEPTMYKDFYLLVRQLHHSGKKIDLLTNGLFDVKEFIYRTTPAMFHRRAPYASIRFSFHEGSDMHELLETVNELKIAGYSVGIWGLNHPEMGKKNALMFRHCADLGIDYREKEYLDKMHGTYKYPGAVAGVQKPVFCTPSELLFDPAGHIFPCHHYLYSNARPFGVSRHPDGVCYRTIHCHDYGLCNPCDVKLKTNRLQESGHCSVTIEEESK